MMIEVKPVVLCGGSGSRLWPLSRSGFPKQFLVLAGDASLLKQATQNLIFTVAEVVIVILSIKSSTQAGGYGYIKRAEISGVNGEYSVLKILEKPDISQHDLAANLNIILGKINYCLSGFMEKGLNKLQNFNNSQRRWQYIYVLTSAGLAVKVALNGRFLRRKIVEYEALKAEIDSIKADLDNKGAECSGEIR